ncbi:hypothetical protein TSAR_014209, partial [Trichomalopsis sarcophagae]
APKREQAIVLDSIEGLTIDDYIDGLEKVIDLNHVRFISKISGLRVCIYLANTRLVENFANLRITVKNIQLKIRPLLEQNKRVVISHVSPHIPNDIIQDYFKSLGIQPMSAISMIKASLSKPGRSHILSFRRQTNIRKEDLHLIPESVKIVYDDTPSWIYFSADSMLCHNCQQSGHTAKSISNKKEVSKILTDLDVFICVESWLSKKNDNFLFAGFKTFRRDRPDKIEEEYLAYKTNTNITSPPTSVEIASITLTNVNPMLDLIICYRAPSLTLTNLQWDQI